ncbi:thiamine-binding protein [Candidatus Aerophobetes bacterium]|uniref:Thiamine-binding protein n=1 Tax=Aerophobetes bacterium TaxID=2030807 RepID=A0A662DGY4_UNCAE|nr:MAG: thiamine-binding protein [Candidatus Aerophobetes bacterium]
MPIMEVNIIPLGSKSPSVSKYIKNALKVLEEEGHIKYQLTAMGTIVEADSIDLLLDLAKKMHQVVLKEGVDRVVTTVKIDERKDKKSTIEGKIKSVISQKRG